MPPHDESRIAQLNSALLFHPCLATDPIGMEYLHDLGDPALVKQLVGIQLNTLANVYQAMAAGAAQAARAIAGAKEQE